MRRYCFSMLIFVALLLVGCGQRETSTPTRLAARPRRSPPPTRRALETPPPGLPPAVSLLPAEAWLSMHVETSQGGRWTAVAFPDRDEVFDERGNRRWVDRGMFLGHRRGLWEHLLGQAAFWDLDRDAYLTDCPA